MDLIKRRSFLKSLSLIATIPVIDKFSFLVPNESITKDAEKKIDLKNNTVERMRIFSSGNIGISTYCPSTMLKINL